MQQRRFSPVQVATDAFLAVSDLVQAVIISCGAPDSFDVYEAWQRIIYRFLGYQRV